MDSSGMGERKTLRNIVTNSDNSPSKVPCTRNDVACTRDLLAIPPVTDTASPRYRLRRAERQVSDLGRWLVIV